MTRVLVLDYDGMVVESVGVKTEAFARLYAPYGESVVKSVVDHHLKNGGLSRYEKFRYAHKNFLGREITEQESQEMGRAFETHVEAAVCESPYVVGALEFLQHWSQRLPIFIASGTPESELRRILVQRGEAQYLVRAYGSPTKKSAILRSIQESCGVSYSEMLFAGDSINDFEPAHELGIPFVGRLMPGERSPFPDGTHASEKPFALLDERLQEGRK